MAEADLEQRGPGDMAGLKQSGAPSIRFARIARNPQLLSAARKAAFQLAKKDPALKRPEHAVLRKVLESRRASAYGAEAG